VKLLSTRDLPDGHPGWEFLLGRTPFFAARDDQRFCYAMYIPSGFRSMTEPLPLLVAVHGTARRAESTRDSFIDFAEQNGVAVLAPLFPGGIDDPNDLHNYKVIDYHGIRFDRVLLGMVGEAAERWNLDASRFLLAGFSGGGQFAHRFALLHPGRLLGVSIGAPGRVTLLDDAPWPDGLGGMDVGTRGLAGVRAQVVVGSLDHAAQLLSAARSSELEQRAGATRVERARTLAAALAEAGMLVDLVEVPGAGHDREAMMPAVTTFLEAALRSAGAA
jgi:poly(3-hydroxybutyrate) depolymerase